MSNNSENLVNYDVVDDRINPDLEARFKETLDEVHRDLQPHHSSQPAQPSKSPYLIWLAGIAFFLILGLNVFIGYQQWQQNQRINNLVERVSSPKAQPSP